MRIGFAGLFVITGLCCPCQFVLASPIVVTLSSPDDLGNLGLGDTVTINVNISGIAADEELFLLGADVILPASNFDVPTTPVSGAAVPDPSGFLGGSGTVLPDRFATGFYDDEFGLLPPITANGLFYTFDATTIGPGTGQIQFDPLAPPQVIGFDFVNGIDIDQVIPGPPLDFVISAVAPVPEPASVMTWSLLLAATATLLSVRRRRLRS